MYMMIPCYVEYDTVVVRVCMIAFSDPESPRLCLEFERIISGIPSLLFLFILVPSATETVCNGYIGSSSNRA
jgi:hypothetical protein